MQGRERFLTALGRGVPDAPPVFLRDLTLSLDELALSTGEVCAGPYDARKASRAVLALHRRLRQDAVVGCVHFVGMEVEALGGTVKYPENGIPSVVRHPFQDTNDPGLPILDLHRDGPFPNVLECYRKVSEAIGDRTAIVCNIEGPVTKAAILRGMENLALDTHFDPGLARKMVSYATELGIEYLTAAAGAARLDCSFLASATDNPDIFGKGMFNDLTLPNVERMMSAARGLGLPTVFHPHGDLSSMENRSLMDSIAGSGLEGFQFAEGNDASALKDRYSDRLCLMGGIDAFSTLLLGPDERIAQETERYLQLFRPWKGYVFMCSCSLHRGMPMRNVQLMVRCARGPLGKQYEP